MNHSENLVYVYHLALDLCAKMSITLNSIEMEELKGRFKSEAMQVSSEDATALRILSNLVDVYLADFED